MSDGAFYGYIALLFASAILLSVVAIRGFGQSTSTRVIDGLFAAGFLAYSIYLLLFFDGGDVRIFIYVFLAPIFAIAQIVKGSKAKRELDEAAAAGRPLPGQPGAFVHPLTGQPGSYPPQPSAYGQPGTGPNPGQPGAGPAYGQPGIVPGGVAGAQGQPGGYVPPAVPSDPTAAPPPPTQI